MDLEINESDNENGDHNKKKKSNKNDSLNEAKQDVKPRTPRVVLNSERLCGDRGITQLPNIFSEVKFKGHGYERQNLDKLLKTIEHWSHRLYPRFMFDDVIEKIEILGTKRPVQTCLRKMRLGMPISTADFVGDDEDAEVQPHRENVLVVDEDLFDTMFDQATSSVATEKYDEKTSTDHHTYLESTSEELFRISNNKRLALDKRLQAVNSNDGIKDSIVESQSSANDTAAEMLTENEILELMEQDDDF